MQHTAALHVLADVRAGDRGQGRGQATPLFLLMCIARVRGLELKHHLPHRRRQTVYYCMVLFWGSATFCLETDAWQDQQRWETH